MTNDAVIRVLFVDDDPAVLSMLRRIVRHEDYECWFASGGEQALTVVAEEGIHVVVSDQSMPGMSGMELLSVLQQQRPDITRVMLTAHIRSELLTSRDTVQRLLGKPWDMVELRDALRDVVEQVRRRRWRSVAA